MSRPSKAGPAASASLELPASPLRHASAYLVMALALLAVGLAIVWERADGFRYRSRSIHVSAPPTSWIEDMVLIPTLAPAATPEGKLDNHLAALARRVERARASVEPPLVAFGAEQLRADIEDTIERIDDRAQVSVHIRDLDSGRVLFDYYGDTLLNPASNQKLLTSSAALDLLGADYVFETRVLLAGDVLYLIGEGDPTIDGEALAALATEVAERVPVGTLSEIVVDDSAFSPRAFGPGYSTEGWGASYEAPSGALSLNFNTVEVTVYPIKGSERPAIRLEPDSAHLVVSSGAQLGGEDSQLEIRAHRVLREGAASDPIEGSAELPRESVLTRIEISGQLARGSRGYKVRRRVVDPGMYTGGAFALRLAELSQTEGLPVRIGEAPRVYPDAIEQGDGDHAPLPRMLDHDDEHDVLLVALRRSPPLIDIIGGVLTYSNNFMAEQILRTLGWRMTGDPGDWDNGSAVVRGYWEALGNDPGQLVFENGSGLSSVGRVTTTGLVDLMSVALRTQETGASLIDALPVAGTEGTMATRLRRSGKRVRAKTGTLNGVSALTGVLTTEDGEPQVAFSILINVRESDRVAAEARREIEDHIVLDVLDHIDGWEATRGTMILDLEPMAITPDTELGQ